MPTKISLSHSILIMCVLFVFVLESQFLLENWISVRLNRNHSSNIFFDYFAQFCCVGWFLLKRNRPYLLKTAIYFATKHRKSIKFSYILTVDAEGNALGHRRWNTFWNWRNNCNFNWVHSRSKSWFHLWMIYFPIEIINDSGKQMQWNGMEWIAISISNITLPLDAMHK